MCDNYSLITGILFFYYYYIRLEMQKKLSIWNKSNPTKCISTFYFTSNVTTSGDKAF